jgi:oxazoline/thiazoline dehydrogenase
MAAPTWAIARGVTLINEPDGPLTLQRGEQQLPLAKLRAGVRAALAALPEQALSESELADVVMAQGSEDELPALFYYVSRLAQAGMLNRVVAADGVRLATAEPIARACRFKGGEPLETEQYVLSRFAYLHRDGAEMLLESPLCQAKIILHSWQGSAIVAELGQPSLLASLAERLPEIPPEQIRDFVSLLLSLEIVCAAGAEGAAEDANLPLRQWEFHDLLFHARSRVGRHAAPFGGTFPFKDSIEPLPALKAPMSDDYVDLYKSDIEALKQDDVPFTAVMEGRRSVRVAGDDPITAEQLGAFLYRAARVRRQETSESGEYAFRIYPGGGGEYELELYLAIGSCEGIIPGYYHYAPAEHRLYRLSDLETRVYQLLGFAARASVREDLPEVLITIAARFQRVSWKYQSIGYALILKDVGVLLQTMYLVATAMNLAPCAVGTGDSDLFAAATGTDYYVETSVGEFLLGAKPADTSAEPHGAELADMPRGHSL